MTTHTLILGIGNPLRGDDGVAVAVLENLQERELPPGVDLLDGGTAGFELALMMQGYQRVIVVDAAEMGIAPGGWRQFTPDEVRLQSHDMHLRGTLHYAGLAEALALADAMDILPPQIVIVGVQPERIEWEIGLTPAVAAAVPHVSAAVLALLNTPPLI
jgi:hydrogenase maturation protease